MWLDDHIIVRLHETFGTRMAVPRSLIVYFSQGGGNARIAEAIATGLKRAAAIFTAMARHIFCRY
jgi:hypothetical protein